MLSIFFRKFNVILLCVIVISLFLQTHLANAQWMDSRTYFDSVSLISKEKNESRINRLWLMAAFSLDLVHPQVGSDLNVLGYGFEAGVSWGDVILLFANHSIKDERTFFPREEHRYDNALLIGSSYRSESLFCNIAAGIGRIDYALRGDVIVPPSNPNGFDAQYQLRSGITYGIAAMANIFFTRFTYFGAGLGLYGCLANSVSYFALELSLFELNVPVPM